MPTGEIEISFLCCFGGKAKDQKKFRISFYEFLPIWFLPQLWSLLVLDEFNHLSTEMLTYSTERRSVCVQMLRAEGFTNQITL